MLKTVFSIAALAAALSAAQSADPQEAWDQAVKAKGGRDRLHSVHSLAMYMKSAQVNTPGPPANWLCVFPDRYFEYRGAGRGVQRAIAVDETADRTASDITGMPRGARHLSASEHDQLILNQIVYILESSWLHPKPVELRRNVLTVEAAGRRYKLFLNEAGLPERVLYVPARSEKHADHYDYRLQRYRDFEGVMLPLRVSLVGRTIQWSWDVDYEVDAKYNPKLFERMPDLANGPEPWRMR
jgi:hypothetical protein